MVNPVGTNTPSGKRVRISRIRNLIATRMHQSSNTTAPVTMMSEVDVSKIVSFRKEAKNNDAHAPSYNAIFMQAVGRTLTNHPELNCSVGEDELVYWDNINIGIAIDTPRGLVVPVVHDVNEKSLTDLTHEIEDLASAARTGKLLPDQFLGGTFTITSLGSYDVDFFTPIINYPEVGILGIGRMRNTLEMQSGQIVQRMKAFLSLTFDHRAVDGAPAARFLKDVRLLIETAENWIGE